MESAETKDNASPRCGLHSFRTCDRDVCRAFADLFSEEMAAGYAAFYLEEGLPLYFADDQMARCLGYNGPTAFSDAIEGKFLNAVHPPDRRMFAGAVRDVNENDGYEVVYRVTKANGCAIWVREKGRRAITDDGRMVLVSQRADVDADILRQRTLEEELRRLAGQCGMLSDLIAHNPAGVCEVALDDAFTIRYGNEGFFALYGYTPEQLRMELHDQLAGAVWPEDFARVRAEIADGAINHKKGFEIEHRLLRRNGTMCWVLVMGNYSVDYRSLHCLIVDITQRKETEEELRINEERFRIALAQTDNTIFDYDIRTKVMMHGDRSAEKYGLAKWTANVPDSLVASGLIHPDSAGGFLDMYAKIIGGDVTASCVVRARLAEGIYAWRKISMTNVFDGEGNAVRAIGILEDIDDQRRREEVLRERSERDTLTGLYNKGATESHIRDFLHGSPLSASALMVIDIDAFKSVNDQHGHPFGDRTLVEISRRISALFHVDDIIGRIGGDEFIVFLKNLRNHDAVEKRARDVCGAFLALISSGGITAQVTCSIGAAMVPRDGSTFEVLYQKADIALYDAKKHGKNQYRLYLPQMGSGAEWTPYSSTQIDVPEVIAAGK